MSTSSLLGWLSYIESQHPSNIELGLERCSLVLSKLNFSRPFHKIFTVAGTNGKGSTCAFLTNYFVSTRQSVGTFTSPHFIDFNERIMINNVPVSDDVICKAFEYIEAIREGIPLTYFEFNTLAAIWIFSQAKLDYWVLEIGLGGRLDSVNMIDCDVAIVTSIALDHMDWLGDSLDVIAAEKAGIARNDKLFINGVKSPPETLYQTAFDTGAIIKQKEHDFGFELHHSTDSWSWWGNGLQFNDLPMPFLPIENAATAVAALSFSGEKVSESGVLQLMETTKLIGRFQTICMEPHIIIDVAHNPEAAEELVGKVTQLDKPAIALCGMLYDKDIESVINILKTSFEHWHLVGLDEPRGAKAEDIGKYLPNSSLYNDIDSGLDAAIIQAKLDDKILVVFGSFVTVGHSLEYLKGKRI